MAAHASSTRRTLAAGGLAGCEMALPIIIDQMLPISRGLFAMAADLATGGSVTACLLDAIAMGEGNGSRWRWNGDYGHPTFTPSIRVIWKVPSSDSDEFNDEADDLQRDCHSFVTDGQMRFLSDCTQALARQTPRLRAFNNNRQTVVASSRSAENVCPDSDDGRCVGHPSCCS